MRIACSYQSVHIKYVTRAEWTIIERIDVQYVMHCFALCCFRWEFSSWLPFLSALCPKDVCRIWKVPSTSKHSLHAHLRIRIICFFSFRTVHLHYSLHSLQSNELACSASFDIVTYYSSIFSSV